MHKVIITALTLAVFTLTGCETTQTTGSSVFPEAATPGFDDGFDATTVTIHKGDVSGTATFEEMINDLADADVILVGEMHGHTKGLDFIATTFEALVERNENLILSMEFYERDQQNALNDYLTDVTDYAKFVKAANRNKGNNAIGHLRMVQLCKENDRAVIAANSPRRYTTMARKQGFEALANLTQEQQRHFEIPRQLPVGYYADTFRGFMSGMAGHNDSEAIIDGFLRSQSVWDQTMAASVAKPVLQYNADVFHVVGHFHVDNNMRKGGSPMTDAIRDRLGDGVKIRSFVVHGSDATSVLSDDAQNAEKSAAANYIIYLPH